MAKYWLHVPSPLSSHSPADAPLSVLILPSNTRPF